MPGVPLSAKNAKVRINTSNILYAVKWTVTPEANLLDVSNFEGGGFEDQIAGLLKLSYTVEGWWDATGNITAAPLNIAAGFILSNVFLYTNDVTGPYWNMASSIIGPVQVSAAGHRLLKYT